MQNSYNIISCENPSNYFFGTVIYLGKMERTFSLKWNFISHRAFPVRMTHEVGRRQLGCISQSFPARVHREGLAPVPLSGSGG